MIAWRKMSIGSCLLMILFVMRLMPFGADIQMCSVISWEEKNVDYQRGQRPKHRGYCRVALVVTSSPTYLMFTTLLRRRSLGWHVPPF